MKWQLWRRLRAPAAQEMEAKIAAGLARLRALEQRTASPELEQKLLRQWREHRLAATAPPSRGKVLPVWLRVSAGLAALLLVAGLWRLEVRRQARVDFSPARPHPAAHVSAIARPQPIRGQASPAEAAKPALHLARHSTRHSATPSPALALAQRGWLPLPDSNPQLPLGRAMVVTVRIPGPMLTSLGLVSTPARSLRGASFPAQVLIGEDNFARAIRFVQTREEK